MSISLYLHAVSDEQVALLRDGSISSNDLITSRAASYDGAGDATHLGCGCIFTVMTLFMIVIPTWQLFGQSVALVVGAVLEVMVIASALQLRSHLRQKLDTTNIASALILLDEDDLCLNHWHSLHFLLTGSDWEGEMPNSFLVHGGDLLPESPNDGEYGPPRLIPFPQLPDIASCLRELNLKDAASRLDAANQTMTIYPRIFDESAFKSELTQLRNLMSRAIDGGKSIVIHMG